MPWLVGVKLTVSHYGDILLLAGRKIRWEHILLVIVVAVALATRLHEIGYNLDGDEIFSVDVASKQFSEMISRSLQDTSHPPLHIVLLHLWIKLFGASEASARALSILFSGAFLLTFYALLRRFIPAWLALGLLMLISLSPFFVYYGQQARPYALISFLSAVNLLAYIRVLEAPGDRGPLAIWASSCVFLVYAQYMAMVLIAFELGLAFLHLRLKRLTILAYGSAAGALILPWLIAAMAGAIFKQTDPLSGISWIEAPTPAGFVWFYVSVFGETGLRVRWLLVVLSILGVAYVGRLLMLRHIPVDQQLLVLAGIGVPLFVYAVSALGPKPVFAERQLIGAAIAFVAIIGLGMATMPRSLALGFLLTLLVWTAAALPRGFPHSVKPPWRDIATQIDTQYDSMRVVAEEGWVSNPLIYYRREGSIRLWSELSKDEKDGRFLLICRPFKCSDIETEALKSRRSQLETWQWGMSSEPGEYNQIRLYEIRSVN
jgi:hypothetical protein